MIRACEDWKAGYNKQRNMIFVSFHICVCIFYFDIYHRIKVTKIASVQI